MTESAPPVETARSLISANVPHATGQMAAEVDSKRVAVLHQHSLSFRLGEITQVRAFRPIEAPARRDSGYW